MPLTEIEMIEGRACANGESQEFGYQLKFKFILRSLLR